MDKSSGFHIIALKQFRFVINPVRAKEVPDIFCLHGGVLMRDKRVGTGFFGLLAFLGLVFIGYSAYAAETGTIPVGSTLAEVKVAGPTTEADQEYLGLKGSDPFTLSQVSGKLVVVDFFNSM
jgi:hypothetical protein